MKQQFYRAWVLQSACLTATVALPTWGFAEDAAPQSDADAPVEAAPNPGEAPAPNLTPEQAAALLQQADQVAIELAERRGIAATGPIASEVQDRATLRVRLEQMIAEEYPPEEIAADERALRTLGVLDADDDLVQLTLDLLESEVAGYYDHKIQVFHILADTEPSAQIMVMSHELFHAIQDQVWGIERVRGPEDQLTDVVMARTALIEGDAVAAMLVHSMGPGVSLSDIPMVEQLLASGTSSPPPGAPEVPAMMWEQLVYPYTSGFSFVLALYRQGGWDAVNAVYTDPPDSTEQVLHPERYLERDAPVWVELGPLSGGLDRYDDDIVGEFGLRAWLGQVLSGTVTRASIDRAAAGWDGDRLHCYAGGDAHDVCVLAMVFDSTAEASAMRRLLPRLSEPLLGIESAAGPVDGESFEWNAGADGGLWVEQRDERLVMVLERGGSGDEDTRRTRLLDWAEQTWGSMTVGAYPERITEIQAPEAQ
jgi:hypothetical protein